MKNLDGSSMHHRKMHGCRRRNGNRCCCLADMPCRKCMRVHNVSGDEAYVRRLSCMGILKGKPISIVRKNGKNEAMIIESGGSKFAIDQNIYKHIEVEEEE